MRKNLHQTLVLLFVLLAAVLIGALTGPVRAGADGLDRVDAGAAAERHLPSDEPLQQWVHDPALLETELADRLEEREIHTDAPETVKLTNLVPPIRFESGIADISPAYLARLQGVLDSMRHLRNVRLHLVGHADDQPLTGALADVYGDNRGLSRERAGEVAEFIQQALALPPESISFEWAGARQPIASNDTPEGRARNRRVEVEVWYDQISQKRSVEDVVVPEEFKRVKICRMETVCKLRYREGHAHRARVKNLIPPFLFDADTPGVSDAFVYQIEQALGNLRDKQNVTVRFIGFTDDVPLEGRTERIYGTHLALSKARARRVALAVKDRLRLPTAAVESNGRGAAQPVASNQTERGRRLNRRVEVEFWYDDPLQVLPEEPQPCPDPADAAWVTKVFDPPWGRVEPLALEGGEPIIPPGWVEEAARALAEVAHEPNARLRFVGYTANERLDRRTAQVYGDDIGLSVARARRSMQAVAERLGLPPERTEHEGRGFVHSSDVVNAGFLPGEDSYVAVEVVYDERALLDDYEGVDVTPLTRELRAKDPLALNLMRITVDGEPVHDPGRSSADIQRCTDVALERTDLRFRFDDLSSERQLGIRAERVAAPAAPETAGLGTAGVRFRTWSNYPHFIERSEVRVFAGGQSARAEPLHVVEVGPDGVAEWWPPASEVATPVRHLAYLLRAYDAEGRFDETAAQPLWLYPDGRAPAEPAAATASAAAPWASGGATPIAVRNIPFKGAGTIAVDGAGIPPGHSVWLAGRPVSVDERGRFAAETILPKGLHTVEVAVLDESGNGELFLRDLELERDDWFYVAMADLTAGWSQTSGPAGQLEGRDSPYDLDSLADGRLAFYVTGTFWDDWKLTASADTREAPVEDLFSNFLDKSPESLLRRIDPDYHYPTFGDDGTVEENAPTSGKFYAKLSRGESHALWGNFKVGYTDNELALVERGLYGGNVHYESESQTAFGEKRFALDGFAAEPGTVGSREEFRGTGGSLYFLRRQDVLEGSERVRIEVRDKASGLVNGVVQLQPTQDYDIDYIQGRILLSEPLASTVDDDLLVRTGGLDGDEAWLVVQYEYTPGFDDLEALNAGGQGHAWLGDHVRIGGTASYGEDDDADSTLYGADVTLRLSAGTWTKFQMGHSDGVVSTPLRSDDGGFEFVDPNAGLEEAAAFAYRGDVSIDLADLVKGARGRVTAYAQQLEAGYSAPGSAATTDTLQAGGTLRVPIAERVQLFAKSDWLREEDGLETQAHELDVAYRTDSGWNVRLGVRHDEREDTSPIVATTQEEGRRTDAVAQVGYDSGGRWRSYSFAQTTLAKSGDRRSNTRYGVGGAYRLDDRILLDGEVSHGDGGAGIRVGTSYQYAEGSEIYLGYELTDERGLGGSARQRGNLVYGTRTRLSDSASVYSENRWEHSDDSNGMTRALGMSMAPSDRWTLGASWEDGELVDRRTQAETKRRAGGFQVGYVFDQLRITSALEYRFDDTEQPDGTSTDRTTWLFKNRFTLQMSPDWRLLGKFDHAMSDSSLGEFYDGGYTEGVLGFAYRPIHHDRLNALAKYTYFYNVPTTDQLDVEGTPAEFLQKSHIASLDLTYEVLPRWTVGAKYAYRLGQVSLEREDPDFFDNSAHLFILRSDLRFLNHWEASVEGRLLELPDLEERRSGALLALYRYLGEHFKVGVGYNFTDFSDDLTDLGYDHQGVFVNLVGTL